MDEVENVTYEVPCRNALEGSETMDERVEADKTPDTLPPEGPNHRRWKVVENSKEMGAIISMDYYYFTLVF